VAFKTIKQMEASNARLKSDAEVGNSSANAANPIFVLREKLVSHSREYFRALFSYDTIASSKSYNLLNLITILVFLWGSLGLWISIHDIVNDELGCKAELVMSILHVYSFFYLIFASWTCVSLGLFLLMVVATNEDFALKLLQKAEKFDNWYMPGGFPFTALLIRAFILRDSSDMTRLEVRTLEKEIKELTERKTRMETKQAQIDADLQEHEAKLAEVKHAVSQRPTVAVDDAVDPVGQASSEAQTAQGASSSIAGSAGAVEASSGGAGSSGT